MIEETQKSLFKPPEPFSDSRLVAEINLRKLGRNLDDAFGITETILKKGSCTALKNIFYGINNLEIPPEMLMIENPAEILSKCFAAGDLKRGNAHRLSDSKIPHDFLGLVRYMDSYSYNNGFASLAHKFKKCFDSHPEKQRERLGLLEQSMEDVGGRFVNSFLSPYRPSDKENSVTYGFHDLSYKRFYVDGICGKFKSLSEKAKQI